MSRGRHSSFEKEAVGTCRNVGTGSSQFVLDNSTLFQLRGLADRLVPTKVPTPLQKLSYHSIHYDLSSPRFETKLDRAASESTFDLKTIER